ncbi:MAG: chemotaxis protein CheC [Christensenellales bacterium]|jgi:chemotaxis protein CheC
MFNLNHLNESQLNFFQEIENIGASHAATALSALLDRPILVRVSNARFCEFSNIADILKGPENLVVSLLVEMAGDLSGYILLILDAQDAKDLSASVIQTMGLDLEETTEFLTNMQQSALLEVANILSGSYLTALSSLTGLRTESSIPRLAIDMAGAIMNLPAVTYGEYGDVVLFLETAFQDRDRCFAGHFFLVPDVLSFSILLKTMGIE